MEDINPKLLVDKSPNRRWALRVHHAWHELRPERKDSQRIYTDYLPRREHPDHGMIQVWAPGEPSKKELNKGARIEEGWYGFASLIKKSTDIEEIAAAVRELLGKFEA